MKNGTSPDKEPDRLQLHAVIDNCRQQIEFVKHVPRWLTRSYQQELNAKVLRNVILDRPPANLNRFENGSKRPDVVLCSHCTDPNHFKVFRYKIDVDPRKYLDTGRTYRGIAESVTILPSPKERKEARVRAQNRGRWVIWTRERQLAGSGTAPDEAMKEALQSGHAKSDLIYEWVP